MCFSRCTLKTFLKYWNLTGYCVCTEILRVSFGEKTRIGYNWTIFIQNWTQSLESLDLLFRVFVDFTDNKGKSHSPNCYSLITSVHPFFCNMLLFDNLSFG